MDFWISEWISGFQIGFLDFTVDFWISAWISGFLEVWISATVCQSQRRQTRDDSCGGGLGGTRLRMQDASMHGAG